MTAAGDRPLPPTDSGRSPVPAPAPERDLKAWASLAGGAVFLVVMLVFVLQNIHSVSVHFFTAKWRIPLALDLLLAAALGAVVMFAAMSLRSLQSRRDARRGGPRRRRRRA